MDSKYLHWCIETLAECKGTTVALLRSVIAMDPEFGTTAPKSVREKVALKFLEDLVGFNKGKRPTEGASGAEIDGSCLVEDVLCLQTRKFLQASQLSECERDGLNLFSYNLLKYILHKRDNLPKSFLNLLMKTIHQDSSPTLSSLKKCSSLSTLNQLDFLHSFIDTDTSRAKKLKVSNGCEIQLPLLSSAAVETGNEIGMVESGTFKIMHELLNISNSKYGTNISQDSASSLLHMTNDDKADNAQAGTSNSAFHLKQSLIQPSSDQNITNRDMIQPIKYSSSCQAVDTDGLPLQEHSLRLGHRILDQNMPGNTAMDLPKKDSFRLGDDNLVTNVSLTLCNNKTSEDILVAKNKNENLRVQGIQIENVRNRDKALPTEDSSSC